MADALALTLSLAALVVAVLSWRRASALAPPPNVVQSQIETGTEPDHDDEWQRFLASQDRERFERALKGGVEVE